MKTLVYSSLLLLLTFLQCSDAQTTVLVGAGIRNGDFNDDTDLTDERAFDVTPFWENIAGPQNFIAARTNLVGTSGTRNGQISHAANQLTGQSTGYTIAEGDSFSVSYEWRDGFNWNNGVDKVRIALFVTNDDTLTGARTTIATTDSEISTSNNTWEAVETDNFYLVKPEDVGKVLFVAIDTFDTDGNGFARIDDFELLVGPLTIDPFLVIESGDYAFGDLVHPTEGSLTSRTVNFRNVGANNSLTLGTATLTSNGDGIFSILDAPVNGTVIPPDGTFEIEISATGGSNFTDYTGELLIATLPNDQDATLPITANISNGNEFFETGSILLVDYDDEVANGIHEVSIRNGGFEDGIAGQSFFDTPNWVAPFSPEADGVTCTLNLSPATGELHGQASGFVLVEAGEERAHPSQAFDFTEWTVAAGDSFDIEVSAMAGFNFDNQGMQMIVEIINANGAFVNDPKNGEGGVDSRLAVAPIFLVGDASNYETFTNTTKEVPRNSPWIGNRVRVRFVKLGLRTAFANIDNVSITGNYKRLAEVRPPFIFTHLAIDFLTQEIIIRFSDNGAAGYFIESGSSLAFEDSDTYTVDEFADRTSFPGEIEFIFEDGEVIEGGSRFWRVVEL
jgi:hypothetical protein